MNNVIQDTWQLNSILDLYNGRENNQNINTAKEYYINHNTIQDGIELSTKISPANGMHKISNAYYYYPGNDFRMKNTISLENYIPYSKYYPLLISYDLSNDPSFLSYTYDLSYCHYNPENYYKLISAKDIDFENAYLKYAAQTPDYHAPLKYHEYMMVDDEPQWIEQTNDTYIFNREITPYINNTYDLLNIVDYLCNRVNCLNFLLKVVKEQKVVEQ